MTDNNDPNVLPPNPPPPKPFSQNDERMWAMLAHLSSLAGLVIPLGNIVGPLIIWQVKKNESSFIDDQGKESLNFQITMLIAGLIAALLCLVLIGFLLLPIVAIFWLVMTIIGGVNANNGVTYRYPFALRLVT
jgi:uncharacterized protein